MTLKVPFSKLERTCSMCPSQWEYMSQEKNFSCYIRYRWDKLAVYLCADNNQGENDCLDDNNLVLLIENLLGDPYCGELTNNALFEILAKHDLLEE